MALAHVTAKAAAEDDEDTLVSPFSDVSLDEKPVSVRAMTVNLKGKHQGKGDPDIRRKAIKLLIDKADVALIFVQESLWVEKSFLAKHVDLSKKTFTYKAVGKEAGVLYDSDHFTFVSEVKVGELKPKVDDRILILKLAKGKATGKLFYAISWHGPQERSTTRP